MTRLCGALVGITCLACGGSPPPPAKPSQPVELSPAQDVSAVAAMLKLPITALEPLPTATEPTATVVGNMFGVRFLPENTACVGLPTKVKGSYIPTFAPPGRASGDLVLAPSLTLDELTACYLALGGKSTDVRVLGPKARELPGIGGHSAFVVLEGGWWFVGQQGNAVDQLVRLRLQYDQGALDGQAESSSGTSSWTRRAFHAAPSGNSVGVSGVASTVAWIFARSSS